MAKTLDNAEKCPLGALKSNDGNCCNVQLLDLKELKKEVNAGSSKYRSDMHIAQVSLGLASIVLSIVAVVLIIGVFAFTVPVVVAVTAIVIPIFIFTVAMCTEIHVSYKIEKLCKAHILFYQKLAHDLINNTYEYADYDNNFTSFHLRQIYRDIDDWTKKKIFEFKAAAIHEFNNQFNLGEFLKYANSKEIYFLNQHLPEEIQKEFPRLTTIEQGFPPPMRATKAWTMKVILRYLLWDWIKNIRHNNWCFQ